MSRKSLIIGMSLMFILYASGSVHADCPSADLAGDCRVDFADFAVFANNWLAEGVMPYSDLRRDDITAAESEMSTANIDASDNNEFMPGTYFIYKTDEGRFGKFMVENHDPNHRLTIRWVTYNTNGSIYSHGIRLMIRGSYACDLDEGLETTTGKDWWWRLQTSTARWLDSENGAKFKLMHRAKAPDGMVWVYVDDPGVSGYEGYMSKYETTNGQYCEYLNSALSDGLITVYNDVLYAVSDTDYNEPYFDTYAADTDSQITYSGGVFSVRTRDSIDMSNHPVVMVSWYGADAFCDYYGYRLPTVSEWQGVADYDGTYIYGCGTTIDYSKANYDVDNPLGLTDWPFTTPVDYYPSFGYGINDMAGNVKEWTGSCYYSQCEPDYRHFRGGCWYSSAAQCSVTHVGATYSSYRYYDLGFRPILDLD